MAIKPPKLVAIDHDNYHARDIGRTSTGQQFFLTNPFEPAIDGSAGCEFVALYLFDKRGKLIEAKIDKLGPRASLNKDAADKLYLQLNELGAVSFERINIAPFAVERFGTTFGLVLDELDDGDGWVVEVQPGNYMAFHEPWDSGEYDT